MATRWKWMLTLALAVVLGGLGDRLLAGRGTFGGRLARASYDLLQMTQAGGPWTTSNGPVALVYLDLESHLALHQNPAERWDRRLHADLVRRLTAAGARMIVFDVLFDAPWPNPEVDADFAAALRGHGKVVLAAERHRSDQATGVLPGIEVRGVQLPTETLRTAAVAWGAAELSVDDDFVVRRATRTLEAGEVPTLAWAAANVLGLAATRFSERDSEEAWLRYYGPPLALPHVSYRSVLEPGAVAPEFLRDKVVFVGALPMVSVFRERRDELRSPIAAWSEERAFMPGVEVHATQLLNWMRGESWHRWSRSAERRLAWIAAFLLAGLLARLRPLGGTATALAAAAAVWWLACRTTQQNGEWFNWLALSAVVVPVGWIAAMVGHTLDWRRQRQRFEAQRRADAARIQRQAELIEQAQEIIVVADFHGRVTYANPSGRAYTSVAGASGDADLAERIVESRFPVPDFASKAALVLAQGRWAGRFELPRDDGRVQSLESRWTLIRNERGQPEAILMISTDITERQRLENEFLRAQKWEAVGSLAGGLAHDLNNTLAPALLSLQLLQRNEARPEVRQALGRVESHARRAVDTVRHVLSFLRGGDLLVTEVDPADLVREIESLVQATFPGSIQVVTLIAPRVGRIAGNTTQLHQALLNLCLNARDAMPAGGQLTLAVDDVDLRSDELPSMPGARAGAFVMIAVSDSGQGIPPEHREKIFDPLFTTKAPGQGTGLGLSSVARIVQQHQGFILVTSDPGAGTTFELYLPRVA